MQYSFQTAFIMLHKAGFSCFGTKKELFDLVETAFKNKKLSNTTFNDGDEVEFFHRGVSRYGVVNYVFCKEGEFCGRVRVVSGGQCLTLCHTELKKYTRYD